MQPTQKTNKKSPDTKASANMAKAKKIKGLKLQEQLKQVLHLVTRYQVVIITVLVAALLAVTSLKMLHYSDPAPDDQRIQENLSKVKQIHLDAKAVERIKQLDDSQTSASSNIQTNRNNPFSE